MAGIWSPAVSTRCWAVRRTRCAGIAAALAALCGCVAPPPSAGLAAIPGIPAGEARIWVYRAYEPYETLARPYVQMNGRIVGISDPGSSFYRDVPPGGYRVTVDTVGRDVYQFVDVAPAARQTVFVKVESAKLWESSLAYRGDTFYTRLIPPEAAEAELARAH